MGTADIHKYDNQSSSDFTPESTNPEAYRFHVAVFAESNGRVSVIALNLPGVVSDGSNEEEALENFAEAASLALESYLEESDEIPWVEASSEDIPSHARCLWVFVDG